MISIRIFVENFEASSFININDYPEADVLTYLSTCRIRRCIIPDHSGSGPADERKLDILVITGDVNTFILLADTNYVDIGESFKYKVLDVKTVTDTLMDMVNYDSYLEEFNSRLS